MTNPNNPPTATAATTAAPLGEPTTQADLTNVQASQMAEWAKEDLLAGRITQAQADKQFAQLNIPLEQRGPDTRTDEQKLLDKQFPSAKPEDYIIRYYTPGQEPLVIPKEVQVFDANARGWMSDAGLPRELGNSLVSTLSKAIQHTHAMTAEQRESYKDAKNAKLHQLFGDQDKLEAELQHAAMMVHELDQKRPGLKGFVRTHGDNAMFVAQLIQATRVYHARRGE